MIVNVNNESTDNLTNTSVVVDQPVDKSISHTCIVSNIEQNVQKLALQMVEKVKCHFKNTEISRQNDIDFAHFTDGEVTQKQVNYAQFESDILSVSPWMVVPTEQQCEFVEEKMLMKSKEQLEWYAYRKILQYCVVTLFGQYY